MADINVQFKNETTGTVEFFLSGGDGLEDSLDPGASDEYTMVVDAGEEPFVGIYQPNGERSEFTVQDGGNYVFRVENGEIVNAFA